MDRAKAWIRERSGAIRSRANQLRYPPWRRRVLVLLIVFPFVLGGILAIALGPIEAIAAFGTAFSLPAFFRHDLVPGPRLSTSIVTKGEHSDEVILPPPELRPLDQKAIVRSSQRAAQETAPEVRRPPRTNQFGFPQVDFPTVGAFLGPRQPDLENFSSEICRYGDELREWLESYIQFRLQAVRQFALVFRIENDGEAPARNVRLRIRLPKDFRELDEELAMESPPSQPRYRGPYDMEPIVPYHSSALAAIGRHLMKGSADGPAPTVSYELDHLVLTYEIGHLNHGPDHLRTDPVVLLAPSDGEFDVTWEALSANPGPATKGSLKIQVSPGVEINPPIATMEEISEDREVHHIVFDD